jgi:GntR family transcriptional regulator, transcriptional repressor for pyruvate dehydrogenase complex
MEFMFTDENGIMSYQSDESKKFKPIKRRRLSEVAIEQIRDFILSNGMKAGDKLPSENEMVVQLGVSRVSVREAIRMLEISGILEVRHGRGVFVKELTGDIFVPLGQWVSMKKQTLQQHFETRLILEPGIAALAANYASAEDIRLLNENISLQRKIDDDDIVATVRLDIEFHCLLARVTRNKDLAMVMNAIARHSFDGWKAALRTTGRNADAVEEHLKIVDALVHKDPVKAQKAMRNHLKMSVKGLEKQGYQNRHSD